MYHKGGTNYLMYSRADAAKYEQRHFECWLPILGIWEAHDP